MKPARPLIVAALLLSCWPWSTARAGVRVGIGIGVGPGFFYRPYYPYGYYGYPVVVAPPPVVVVPQPTVIVPPATVAAPPPAYPPPAYPPPGVSQPNYPPPPPAPLPAEPVPVPSAPQRMPEQIRTVPTPVTPTGAWGATSSAQVEQCLRQLASTDERTRTAAMIELGRQRATQAIDPLTTTLSSDPSPTAREAAARALGLIGSPAALSALQQAAQADEDREVRSSARFAVEVIRSGGQR